MPGTTTYVPVAERSATARIGNRDPTPFDVINRQRERRAVAAADAQALAAQQAGLLQPATGGVNMTMILLLGGAALALFLFMRSRKQQS